MKFYTSEFSPYKFFKLFFITLSKYDSQINKKDIVQKLYNAKNSRKYEDLFADFSFFDNGIFISSRQVEDGLYQMFLSGIISRKNLCSPELIINLSEEEYINSKFNTVKINKMDSLVKDFVLS